MPVISINFRQALQAVEDSIDAIAEGVAGKLREPAVARLQRLEHGPAGRERHFPLLAGSAEQHGYSHRSQPLASASASSTADNPFSRMAGQDVAVECSAALRAVAIVLTKLNNDLRWMGSGPLAGLAEIQLQALQPGSSIMPGKVNPVLPEAALMAAAEDFTRANAELVGGVEARHAARLSEASTRNGTLGGPLQVAFRYVDFLRALRDFTRRDRRYGR